MTRPPVKTVTKDSNGKETRTSAPITIPTTAIAKGHTNPKNQYVCSYVRTKDLFPNDPEDDPWRTAISYEPIISESSKKHVHHILIFACGSTQSMFQGKIDPEGVEYNCQMQRCFGQLVGAWAVGAVGRVSGLKQGLILGGQKAAFYEIQTHYFNRNMDEGVLDASGIQWNVLPRGETRPIAMETFLNVFQFSGLTPMNHNTQVAQTIPAECWSELTEAAAIKVDALLYHGHFDTKKAFMGRINHELVFNSKTAELSMTFSIKNGKNTSTKMKDK